MRPLLLCALPLAACFGGGAGDAPDDTAGPADTGAPSRLPDAPEQVEVPATEFTMGCDDCDPDEAPPHLVRLAAFRIDRWEVTNAWYEPCVTAYGCGEVPDNGVGPDGPVTGLTYEDAADYCAWRGMALPTEAQWELAARGVEGRTWPWGEASPDCELAASRSCDGGLVAAGSHPAGASPYGAEDLAGNAWEWVSDWYDADYYATSPAEEPTGGDAGGLRTVRGVDTWSDPAALRSSNREYAIPDARGPLVGLRCVDAS